MRSSALISIILFQIAGCYSEHILITGCCSNDTSQMEMLFDNGKTKICQPILDYPFQYDSGFGSATGVSTDENMIICGGQYARTRKKE